MTVTAEESGSCYVCRRSDCASFRKKRGGGGSEEVDAPLPVAKKSKAEKKEESQLKVCSEQQGGLGAVSWPDLSSSIIAI